MTTPTTPGGFAWSPPPRHHLSQTTLYRPIKGGVWWSWVYIGSSGNGVRIEGEQIGDEWRQGTDLSRGGPQRFQDLSRACGMAARAPSWRFVARPCPVGAPCYRRRLRSGKMY